MANIETNINNKRLSISRVTVIIVVAVCGILIGGFVYWNYSRFLVNDKIIESPQSSQESSLYNSNFQKITQNLPFGLTQLEIAKTPEQQEQGLMYRKNLCNTCAMLFENDMMDSRTFWMKNTLVPLDIIFMDDQFRVINIAENTKINQTTNLYSSTQPAQYILEVSANWSRDKKITTGTIIDFKNIITKI